MDLRKSVASKLRWAFVGVILVFGMALTLSLVRLATFNATVSEITGPRLADIEIIDAWSACVPEWIGHARNILIAQDKNQIQGEIASLTALAEKSAQFGKTLSHTARSPEATASLQEALAAQAALVPLNQQFLSQALSGEAKVANDTLLQRARPAQLALIASLSKLGEYQHAQINRSAADLEASYKRTRWLSILLSMLAVAIACLLAYFFEPPHRGSFETGSCRARGNREG